MLCPPLTMVRELPIDAGVVSNADLLQALPFLNELVELHVSGAQLRAALENSISLLGADDVASTPSGRFLDEAPEGAEKGIAPDVRVPLDTPGRAETLLVESGAFFDFGE